MVKEGFWKRLSDVIAWFGLLNLVFWFYVINTMDAFIVSIGSWFCFGVINYLMVVSATTALAGHKIKKRSNIGLSRTE